MGKTMIVATVGPCINNKESLRNLAEAGVDVFRFNFSHAKNEDPFGSELSAIEEIRKETGIPIKTLADIQGPKIRLGRFGAGKADLRSGDVFTLTTRTVEGDETIVSIDHSGTCSDVVKGSIILINDGLVRLEVIDVAGTEVRTKVLYGGLISDRKGVNLPGSIVSLPALSEKDDIDLRYISGLQFDFIAASFIRKAADVQAVIAKAREYGSKANVISKIETREAVTNIESIIAASDGILVARGDLAIEVRFEHLPVIQKVILRLCSARGKFSITATQMMESMISNPVPTRAEITDVANAVIDGTRAVMLSAETAVGKYPLETVIAMEKILRSTEKAWEDKKIEFSDIDFT